MNKLPAIILPLLLLVGCATPRSNELGLSRGTGQQILVTVRQAESAAIALLGAPARRYLHRREYGASPNVERILNQLAGELELTRIEGWPIPSLAVYCEVLEVPEGRSVEAVITELADDPRVDLAQRMNVFHTLSAGYDDPYVDLQPSIISLGIEAAHAVATGRDVLVAVIDSAVDTAHPDLRKSVGISRDLVAASRRPRHGEVHGTAIAGVIASAANNAEGIVGIAPDVTLAALRACWSVAPNGSAAECSTFSLAQALETALRLEPEIINLSLSGPSDPLLSRLLDQAIRRGIIVVAAAPESPNTQLSFPSSHAEVISVQPRLTEQAALTRLRLAAPAEEILTTTPDAGYSFLSGSSLAAAHVSGIIALLVEQHRGMDAHQIAALLDETATHNAGLKTVNACRALARLAGDSSCDGTQIASNPQDQLATQRRSAGSPRWVIR